MFPGLLGFNGEITEQMEKANKIQDELTQKLEALENDNEEKSQQIEELTKKVDGVKLESMPVTT